MAMDVAPELRPNSCGKEDAPDAPGSGPSSFQVKRQEGGSNTMGALTLVSLPRVTELEPAALYEREAARYVKISLRSLRELSSAGRIPAYHHPGRVRKIYLKIDLDEYLRSLQRA